MKFKIKLLQKNHNFISINKMTLKTKIKNMKNIN